MRADSLSIRILRKMYFYGYIGGRHTSIDNIQKSFPKHKRGNVKDAVKTLIKANLIKVDRLWSALLAQPKDD